MTARLPVPAARAAAAAVLEAAGLAAPQAESVARRLVEGDLLGHRTHGLAQLPTYLERIGDGRIATAGRIEVLHDGGAHFSWHTPRLPGAWVMEQLVAQALERSAAHAVVTATLANCTHIGALQAYLEDIGRRGLLALLMVTDPGVASVAPPGGADAVTTSNPIAACIPTGGDPVLIDQSTTLASNGAIAQHAAAGRRLPGRWLLDGQGVPTDDPAVMQATPPGTLLPVGGENFGYKGFACGLLVEAFALALSGFGHDLPRVRGAQGVFLQIMAPAGFGGGADAFLRATDALVAQCHASRRIDPDRAVRLPGERALQSKREQQRHGLLCDSGLLATLDGWAARLGSARRFTAT
ncbi:Ldh family oxidoreductase [Xylophilus sp.]|uniref:Ldh family oxidoreductase n=1 Tax=Xylophilus sp. TaxID=2653893 RepID=UPI0013BC542C|nr:Ldh family oxidoreductase [Xylophilus sp.]KAF1046103.1 MAG: Hydroxycarboxylate dehydrogenase B [Xylophilus sp.]